MAAFELTYFKTHFWVQTDRWFIGFTDDDDDEDDDDENDDDEDDVEVARGSKPVGDNYEVANSLENAL